MEEKDQNASSEEQANHKKLKISTVNELQRESCVCSSGSAIKNGYLSHIQLSHISKKDSNRAGFKEFKNTAQIFCARIQRETEEFMQHIENQIRHQQNITSIESLQRIRVEDDEALQKMRLLLMIHTTCSNITNLLMHSS